MWLHRILALILTMIMLIGTGPAAMAQQNGVPDPHAATGGAQTLADILARQRGEPVSDNYRRLAIGDPANAQPITGPLGTLGGASDADIYRSFRFGTANIISTVPGELGRVVIQDGGMRWLAWRRGPLPKYGGYVVLAMIGLLLLFYLFRGKIRLDGDMTGQTVLRFHTIERIAHWSMAVPFIFLAITGLVLLFGRSVFIPLLGKETFSIIAAGGKYIHNYIAWVFMAGLVSSFLLWVWKNFPEKSDFVWILKAGGLFTKGVHPPAGKFNAGEKMVFWIVILFGSAMSLTGLSLVFPFDIQFFSGASGIVNDLGIPQFLGFPELKTALAPQEEMQLAQAFHAAIAFLFIAVIIAHIYLGTVGMEGALDGMTKGKVDVQWAKEHHSLWYDEIVNDASGAPEDAGATTPAE